MMIGTIIALFLLGSVYAAPVNDAATDSASAPQTLQQNTDDLKADASSAYGRRYSDWAGYPGNGYNTQVTGYGLLEDRYSPYNNGVYDNIGYKGYDSRYAGINGYAGYGGYKGFTGYDSNVGGYAASGVGNSGYGGYGGYGGNGGLTSYNGYNNPYYQGAQHLGFGYYNKKSGYGNIYNGITPSLVTGYRGYSRR